MPKRRTSHASVDVDDDNEAMQRCVLADYSNTNLGLGRLQCNPPGLNEHFMLKFSVFGNLEALRNLRKLVCSVFFTLCLHL